MKKNQIITLISSCASQLGDKVSELSNLYYDLANSNDDVETCERDRLESRMLEAEKKFNNLQARLQELTEQRDKYLQARLQELTEQRDKYVLNYSKLRNDYDKLVTDFAERQKQLSDSWSRIQRYTDMLVNHNINPATGDEINGNEIN